MRKKICIYLYLCVYMLICIGCAGQINETESSWNEENDIEPTIESGLVVEKQLYDVEHIGENIVMFKEMRQEQGNMQYYYENYVVEYIQGEEGKSYYKISKGEKAKLIECVRNDGPKGHSYVHYMDMDYDGVKDIYIVYPYTLKGYGVRYGMLAVDSVTLEKKNVVASGGTGFTSDQAKDINSVIDEWSSHYKDYLFGWNGMKEFSGDINEDYADFNVHVSDKGIVTVDIDTYFYNKSPYKRTITVQLAYDKSEFVVEKVIMHVQKV